MIIIIIIFCTGDRGHDLELARQTGSWTTELNLQLHNMIIKKSKIFLQLFNI